MPDDRQRLDVGSAYVMRNRESPTAQAHMSPRGLFLFLGPRRRELSRFQLVMPRINGGSFVRVIRGFAEASLVALGFALAILLIGTPLALLARGILEGLSWLVRL